MGLVSQPCNGNLINLNKILNNMLGKQKIKHVKKQD